MIGEEMLNRIILLRDMLLRKAIAFFSFTIIAIPSVANPIEISQLDDIGLPVVRIETVNGEIPTCN